MKTAPCAARRSRARWACRAALLPLLLVTAPVAAQPCDSLNGFFPRSGFGSTMALVDLNGDGWKDLAVAAPSAPLHGPLSGAVYIYFGGKLQTGVPDLVLAGEHQKDLFGFSVAPAGDVNGDGYEDLIVGAPTTQPPGYAPPYYDSTARRYGMAFLFLGGTSPDSVPAVALADTAPQSSFGRSVAGIGDADGDGFADCIIGAKENEPWSGPHGAGRVFVYRGDSTMETACDTDFCSHRTIWGNFGAGVADAGDINGDGIHEFLVVSGHSGGEIYWPGYVFLFNGATCAYLATLQDPFSARVRTTSVFGRPATYGDFNGDGVDDLLVGNAMDLWDRISTPEVPYPACAAIYCGGSTFDPHVQRILTTGRFSTEFGSAVAVAGDLNNDGFEDFLIGAPGDSLYAGHDVGAVYLYHGSALLDDTIPQIIPGRVRSSRFGESIGGVTDIDGDGINEIIIGAPGPGADSTLPGTVYFVKTGPSTSAPVAGVPVRSAMLFPNYPNPFNPHTTIRYYLPASAHVTLRVCSMLGQEVAVLEDGLRSAGMHEAVFNGGGLATGTYLCRLDAGTFHAVRLLLLIR